MAADHARTQRFQRARKNPTLAVLEGFHALKHALRFGADILEAWRAEDTDLRAVAVRLAPDVAERMDEVCRPIPRNDLVQLGASRRADLVALARRPPELAAGVGAASALSATESPVVFLDRPTHHGNIGAVVRVAAAAGAAGVLTTGPHDPWHPASIRGGAGLQFALPVVRVPDPPETARPVVALDPEGEPLVGIDTAGPAPVLVFGSERTGISPELLAQADRRVRIPMREGVSSLNLATAVAVALYGSGTGRSSSG